MVLHKNSLRIGLRAGVGVVADGGVGAGVGAGVAMF